LGPDFGKVVEVREASNVKFGTPSSIGNGLVRVPVYLDGAHKGAIGVRFTSDVEIVDVTKGSNNVMVDASTDVVAIAGNGTFDANQPLAYVTMKESGLANISDVRFNDNLVGGHTVNMVETNNNSVAVYPNPVASSMTLAVNVATSGSINVTVFDSFGKLVSIIANENVAPGTFTASWDGNDNSGNAVAAGTYMVRVEGAGVSTTQTFTVVR
jgi:flagellar hook assembly protein FlgD